MIKRSKTNKSVLLLLIGFSCLVIGLIWFVIGLNNSFYAINPTSILVFFLGIFLVYKTLVKTRFESQSFELKDYWKKVEEQEENETNN